DAGFATLFRQRWCIVTPTKDTPQTAVDALADFWVGLGATVEVMDARHHDLVLAVTSHIPHLIAYTIVGTASDLEEVTRGEVIKYSAGGFRDFTRIAASNPTMWRDVFLSNRDAVLEVLGRFTEDLSLLQRAIRNGDGDTLFELFDRTRTIRRSIIDEGQDDARPDFGRKDH
ncbi:MAG TPA: prephenate/arogenate dehydrogenase family protein, partial [Erythrobacter sp.]|nr:prephenate/arogenate dehydrogenase family protein [Erythrobacter sp.]